AACAIRHAAAAQRRTPITDRPEQAMTLPRLVRSLFGIVLLSATAIPAAGQNRDLDRLLEEVTADVEANRKLTQVIVDKLFSFAELGFHEVETKAYLSNLLRENGFTVEDNVSGIPTAWWAR